jgi:hypothetical protein
MRPTTDKAARPRRLLYGLNHQTLLAAEVPILRELGWEVYVPKRLVNHHQFRSGMVTYEYDASLTLAPSELEVLNRHHFHLRRWSPTVAQIIRDNFDAVVGIFDLHGTLAEPVRKFPGLVVARVFGREHPRTYTELIAMSETPRLLDELAALGERFVMGQGFSNIAEIEDEPLKSRARLIACPLPGDLYRAAGTWTGDNGHALFLCPMIGDDDLYQAHYRRTKDTFGHLRHRIFGRQMGPVDDPAVLPSLSNEELIAQYARSAVFVYPWDEPRHLHYSPVEAMVVGCPVLYLKGATIDLLLGGADLPGRCADLAEMHHKARRLLEGERAFADAVRTPQQAVVDTFDTDLVRRQWAAILPLAAEPRVRVA